MPINTVDKLEKEASEWLESVTGEEFDCNKTFQENLKDGTILCKCFNACFVEMKVKYTHSAMPFKQMENIATFLHALSKLPNFRSFDLFSTVDLYEGKNIPCVTRCILACKRVAEREALKDAETNPVMSEKESNEIKFEAKHEHASDKQEESVEEVESFEEINPTCEESDEFEVVEQIQSIQIDEEMQPEIVLIDSPVFADDESEPLGKEVNEEFEEYETFTMENPGTFEIQITTK